MINSNELIAQRAGAWQVRTRTLELGPAPLLMGIVNVTPDSFSDGGAFFDRDAAVKHGLALAAAGADLLDIGGESTRPYADPVDEAEELQRTTPVVEALAARTSIPISIDTSKSRVAAAAVEAGAEIINDVTALTGDSAMPRVAIETGAGVCAMHMQGAPQTMQDAPHYDNVVSEIIDYLAERRDALIDAGVPVEKICLDPGIGFGKTHAHNVELMQNCWRFHALRTPLLVGHSRKGFLGKILGDNQVDRTAATIGGALALACQGVQIIRVHDVQPVREALLAFAACGGR